MTTENSSTNVWGRVMRGALLFQADAIGHFRDRADVFFQGFLIVLAISLFAGLPTLAINAANALSNRPIAAATSATSAAMERALDQATPLLQGLPDAVRQQIIDQMRQGFEVGSQIASQIGSLPTILPRPLGGILEAIGHWVASPFAGGGIPLAAATLGTWLGYGIWVMLAAKILGGVGSLPRFFGTTALYALPHALNILNPVPILGPVVAFITFLWGIGIYIRATAVSHQLSVERAFLAVLLPLLIAVVLLIIAVSVAATLIAISVVSGR